MLVVGVDGARTGWVAVFATEDGFSRVEHHPDFDAVMAHGAEAEVIAVDMPVGLLESGWRDCDAAARATLGRRASTVFPTPPRPVLESPSYEQARALCRERTGKAPSKQAFNLAAKILEVDAHAGDARIHEVHPELAFVTLVGRVLPPKKSWTGMTQRRDALTGVGFDVPAEIGDLGHWLMPDDVLDAAVVAWSARRIAAGVARSWPSAPTQRAGGRDLLIWA